MELAVGDIIWCDAPITDHGKYHICVLECSEEGQVACFLFLNSNPGYRGDLVLKNEDFLCIPPSKTGLSIVSFSMLARYNSRQLKIYRAKKVGQLDPKVAKKLEEFARTVPTLTSLDRRIVLNGLSKVIHGAD